MIPIYQVHPALVHFPIVLFIVVFVLDVIIVARRGNLSESATLQTTALWLMWAGVVSAIVAAVFGGIAAGYAMESGFSGEHIGEHQGLAQITLLIFLVLAIVRSVCRWKNIALAGTRGWIFAALMLVGVGFIVETAYHGGHLVYEMGVNVKGVTP